MLRYQRLNLACVGSYMFFVRNAWANYHVLSTHSVGILGGSNMRLRTQLNQQSAPKRIFPLFPQARLKWKVALKMAQICFPFLYYAMVYRRCLMWTGEGMEKTIDSWLLATWTLEEQDQRHETLGHWQGDVCPSTLRSLVALLASINGGRIRKWVWSFHVWWSRHYRLMWLLHVVASIQDGLLHVRKFTWIRYLLAVDAFPFCVHVICTILNLAWSVAWKWVCQACIYKQKWCQPGKSTWIVHSNLII